MCLGRHDTNGTEESVHISEVSLFQGLKQELFLGKEKVSLLERCPLHCTQELFLGKEKVSILERCPLHCTQELFLGKEKVSLLERCPHFRSVLGEGFH